MRAADMPGGASVGAGVGLLDGTRVGAGVAVVGACDGAGDGTIDGGLAALGGDAARIQAMAAAGGGGLRGQNQAAKGKMTYKVFESARLPELKAEKPGLQGSQYRDSETATLSRFVALSVSLTQPLLQCARRSGSAPQ